MYNYHITILYLTKIIMCYVCLCFNLGDNERIIWNWSGSSNVRLKKPTVEDIQHVIEVLKQEKNLKNVTHNRIVLWDSLSQPTQLLLSQLNETAVNHLEIWHTTLTENCGLHYLNKTDITKLVLYHCTIAEINSICELIETSKILTVLRLITGELTQNELNQILDSLSINEAMSLHLLPDYMIVCTQHINYQKLQQKLHYWP